MRKSKRPTDGGGSWMDTYGDMVTLLLTFFIMLFSMSTVDAQKWSVFVQSISAKDKEGSEEVLINSEIGKDTKPLGGETVGSPDDSKPSDPSDPTTLYLTIADALNAIDISDATVMRGDDYTYISFENSVFFGGGSSVMTPQGLNALDALCKSIAPAADSISQVEIMSHTAKVNPDGPSDIRVDRTLSSLRAAEAAIYIGNSGAISPKKLVTISYGENRPIADNRTPEGRAKNRRIEFILLDKDAKLTGLENYYEDLKSGKYNGKTIITTGDSGS